MKRANGCAKILAGIHRENADARSTRSASIHGRSSADAQRVHGDPFPPAPAESRCHNVAPRQRRSGRSRGIPADHSRPSPRRRRRGDGKAADALAALRGARGTAAGAAAGSTPAQPRGGQADGLAAHAGPIGMDAGAADGPGAPALATATVRDGLGFIFQRPSPLRVGLQRTPHRVGLVRYARPCIPCRSKPAMSGAPPARAMSRISASACSSFITPSSIRSS